MQIYVVTSQGTYFKPACPIAAFSDYPSALTYAKSIFKASVNFEGTAKDLIFFLTITQATPTTTAVIK
jgi:hypothetical protein